MAVLRPDKKDEKGKLSIRNNGGKTPKKSGPGARKSNKKPLKIPDKIDEEEKTPAQVGNQITALSRRPGGGVFTAELTRAEHARITVDILFDFRPFLFAPACVEHAKRRGGILQPLRIKQNLRIPSPLAENIHPSRLPEIKRLCEAFGKKGYNKSDQEVWLSWKRAYDLWNNHYIESRVNVKWVQETMEKVREQVKSRNRKRKRKPFTQKQPLRLDPYEKITCFREELPPAKEGRKWVQTTKTEEIAVQDSSKSQLTGKKIKQKKKRAINGTAFEGKTFLKFEKDQPVSGNGAGEEMEAKKPAMELINVTAPTDEQQKPADYAELKKPKDQGGGSEVSDPKSEKGALVIWVPIQPGAPGTELDADDEEEVDEWEFAYRRATVPVWESVDDPYFQPTQKRQKTITDGKDSARADKAKAEPEDGEYDEPENWTLYNDDGVEADGSSGGFISMKALAAGTTIDERNEGGANQRIRERVDNTMWRPRRVGEEPPEINLTDRQRERAEQREATESDFARFRSSTDFEVDGGVDCATAPFPLLRWAHSYLRNSEGLFRKRKVWDRVTGTIFNMPTNPLDKKVEPDSEKGLENPSHGDVFPLDIRRVQRVLHDKQFSVSSPGEDIVELKGMEVLRNYRRMTQDDPWWVHPDQELRRDVPPRRWPIAKGHNRENELLPYDDLDWQDHRERDSGKEYMYFATNLHGGTLLVNGVEVRRGAIVGPLPQFAIIETPGGQVSFWHGWKGREFGDGKPLAQREEHEQWKHLRQSSPEWQYAGVFAGEVWAARIEERVKREEDGVEGEPDNDVWQAWKEWKEPDADVPSLAYQTVGRLTDDLDYEITTSLMEPRAPPGQEVTGRLPVPIAVNPDSDNVRVPPAFSSPEEELKHLAIINEEFERRVAALTANPVIQPQGSNFWNGRRNPVKYPAIPIVKNRVIEEQWAKRHEKIEARQKEYVERMKTQRQPGVRTDGDDSNGDEAHLVPEEPEWWEEELGNMPFISLTHPERDEIREALTEIAQLQNLPADDADLVRRTHQRYKREADARDHLRQVENVKRRANNLPEIPPKLTARQRQRNALVLAKAAQLIQDLEFQAELKPAQFKTAQDEAAKKLGATSREPSVTPPPLPPAPSAQLPSNPDKTRKPPKKDFRIYPGKYTGEQLEHFKLWDKYYIDDKMPSPMASEIVVDPTVGAWFNEYLIIINNPAVEVTEDERRENLRTMFKNQAASVNLKADAFAKSKGFDTIEAMVRDSMQKSKDGDDPNNTHTFPGYLKPTYNGDEEGGEEEHNFYLAFHADRALEDGLHALARRKGVAIGDVLKTMGFKSLEDYQQDMKGFLQDYTDLPPDFDPDYKEALEKEKDKFRHNMKVIVQWQEFEAQIDTIERNQLPETKVAKDGKKYAVI